MEGLLRPSMAITESQQQQNYSGEAQLVSNLPQQKVNCDETGDVFQEKRHRAVFSTAPILSQFIVAYTPSFTISAYDTCE